MAQTEKVAKLLEPFSTEMPTKRLSGEPLKCGQSHPVVIHREEPVVDRSQVILKLIDRLKTV